MQKALSRQSRNKRRFTLLRAAMAEVDMSQEEFALRIGRRKTFMQERLAGRTDWSLSEMYAAMDYFKIPHNRLHEFFPPEGDAGNLRVEATHTSTDAFIVALESIVQTMRRAATA